MAGKKKSILLSVVIPTYNRTDILPRCLSALDAQTLDKDKWELIIVDDGSTDDTPEVVEQCQQELSLAIRYIRQENKGPAGARNTGIKAAKGTVIWITGDDYIAEPDCLEQHFTWHEDRFPEEEAVVLGYATWHPELDITEIMHWVENGGQQFFYHQINHGEEISPFHFITCNISFKRSFFEKHGPFDETYPSAMGEDTDLGIKFALAGMRFYFNRKAVAYHHHPIDEEGNFKRMILLGDMLVLQEKNFPKLHFLHPFVPGYQKVVFTVTTFLVNRLRAFINDLPEEKRRWILRRYFRIQELKAYPIGIKSGMEREMREGKNPPQGECVLVLTCDDLNPFYRHIDRIEQDFHGKSLVLIGNNDFRTKIKMHHPAISWFLLRSSRMDKRGLRQSLAHDIRELNCDTAAIIDIGVDFDYRAAAYFRKLGVRNVYLYNARGQKVPVEWADLVRGQISFKPMLQTTIWAAISYFQRWFYLIKDTLLIPVWIGRYIITKVMFKD